MPRLTQHRTGFHSTTYCWSPRLGSFWAYDYFFKKISIELWIHSFHVRQLKKPLLYIMLPWYRGEVVWYGRTMQQIFWTVNKMNANLPQKWCSIPWYTFVHTHTHTHTHTRTHTYIYMCVCVCECVCVWVCVCACVLFYIFTLIYIYILYLLCGENCLHAWHTDIRLGVWRGIVSRSRTTIQCCMAFDAKKTHLNGSINHDLMSLSLCDW